MLEAEAVEHNVEAKYSEKNSIRIGIFSKIFSSVTKNLSILKKHVRKRLTCY